MCICIDCRWVDSCRVYHAVETRHHVEHLTSAPDFEPSGPRINVNLQPDGAGATMEWDVVACGSFAADVGRWQRLRPGLPVPR